MISNPLLFIDIDTQFDFMHPQGKLYVQGAETLVPNLKQLLGFALKHQIPILSSVDAHPSHDPEFKQFPPHCIQGTAGQKKIKATQIPNTLTLSNQTSDFDLGPVDAIVVEKTVFNLFGNPNTEQIISQLSPQTCIVFGVATDYCVKAAALELVKKGYHVKIVSDAIKAVTEKGKQESFEEFKTVGIDLVTTQDILGEKQQ